MARHEGDIVTEWPQLGHDRIHQGLGVAAGKICPPDRALEQDVTDLSKSGGTVEEDDMAGGMAGTVADLPYRLTQSDRVALIKPSGRCKASGFWHAIGLSLRRDAVYPELIFRVWADYIDAGFFLHFRCTAGMIQVPVSDPDLI